MNRHPVPTPALRYLKVGLAQAQTTLPHKYFAQGRALRARLLLALGQMQAGGTELRQAFAPAEQLRSPVLVYPLAYDLGRCYEGEGRVKA